MMSGSEGPDCVWGRPKVPNAVWPFFIVGSASFLGMLAMSQCEELRQMAAQHGLVDAAQFQRSWSPMTENWQTSWRHHHQVLQIQSSAEQEVIM